MASSARASSYLPSWFHGFKPSQDLTAMLCVGFSKGLLQRRLSEQKTARCQQG